MKSLRKLHGVPGLNTTSTADISFMLLIFFLVTTSMDVDKGLLRQLPAPEPKHQEASVVDKSTLPCAMSMLESIMVRYSHDCRKTRRNWCAVHAHSASLSRMPMLIDSRIRV